MKKNSLILIIIALTVFTLLLGGCAPQFFINNLSGERVKQEDEHSQSLDLGDAKKLDIENQTGMTIIKKTSDSNVSVKTRIRVDGQVQEEVDKVINEMKTRAEIKEGKLIIRAISSDGTDFWEWKQKNYRMLNVSINFEVLLPRDLETYKVRMMTGNVSFEGLEGSIDTENVTGMITLNDVTLSGDNNIKLITGNIDIDADIADAETLDLNNITGNVTVTLPGDASLKLKGSVVTGTIGGSLAKGSTRSIPGAKIDTTLGEGNTDVSITLVTGNITVNSK